MSVLLGITAVNTKSSSKTTGQSKGDLVLGQISTKQSQHPGKMSEILAGGQQFDGGLNMSDTGRVNPFSNVLKKQLLSQTSADADETLLSGQEQKVKIKGVPVRDTKIKNEKTGDNTTEIACAAVVLSPQPQPRMAVLVNKSIQQPNDVKQPSVSTRQGEKQSEQASRKVFRDTLSPRAIAEKGVAEPRPEIKTELAAVSPKTALPIEITPMPQDFQSRMAHNQANRSSAVLSVPVTPAKALPKQPLSSTQAPIQTQVVVQPQPKILPIQTRQTGSSLAAPSMSSKESPQVVVKKESADKKTALPDKVAFGEAFQSAIVSPQSPQNIAKTASQAVEKTGVISTDSAGRYEALKPADQILQHIPTTMTGSFQQIRMTLAPEELGTIRITFRQQDGQVHGIIEVEKAAVQQDIEKAMPQIAASMVDHGIQLRRIEVITMQNNPNSPNDQFSQDFNPFDQHHPTGQASNRSSGGGTSKNTLSQHEEDTEDRVRDKSLQVLDDSGLNMYA